MNEKGKTEYLGLRLSVNELKAIQNAAFISGITPSEYVRRVVREHIAHGPIPLGVLDELSAMEQRARAIVVWAQQLRQTLAHIESSDL